MTRLLVVGVEAMDWFGFAARDRAGDIPRLSALRAAGIAGWLSGAPRGVGPAAAVSLATGVQPEIHGVWRGDEVWPGGLRPIGRASWRVQPLWARLEAAGTSTGSVGWPASRPGADWPGLHIDTTFADSSGANADAWALPLHCAPAEYRNALRARRVHVSQISADMLAPLAPPGAFDDPVARDTVAAMASAMARAATTQSAAVWMLGRRGARAPDAVFVHQPILAHARRAVGDGARPGGGDAISAAWRFLDGLIGRLADLAGPDCLVFVASPGGGGSPGVILAAGPGVTEQGAFEGAGLLDIAPTILAVFDLVDPALPGSRIAAIAPRAGSRAAPTVRSPGRLMPDPRIMGPLRLLGYRPPRHALGVWRAAGLGDLAAILLDRDPAGALGAADAALAIDPNLVTALRVKVRAHVALGQAEPLKDLGERLTELAPDRAWGALASGAHDILRGAKRAATPWLKRAEADPDTATLLTVGTLWIAAGRVADAARVFAKVVAIDPGNVTAEIGLAMAASARRDFLNAEAGLNRARAREPGRPAIWLQLAQVYARSGRKAEAARMADKARTLGADPALASAAAVGRLPL